MRPWQGGPAQPRPTKPKIRPRDQRCCPTCLNPMRIVDDHWECDKHGAPTKP